MVISFLTGNILVSIVGCSIIGLVLNREIVLPEKIDFSEIGVSPSEYHQRFQTLKEHVSVLDYDLDVYEDTVHDSVFLDTDGKLWSLGIDTLEWYQLINDEWMRAEPINKMILFSEAELTEHV